MKKLLSFLLVLVVSVSYAQKLRYIEFTAPEGARVYISSGKPYFIEDSLMSFDDVVYLGETKGIISYPKKKFPKNTYNKYLIVEKSGYKVNITPLELTKIKRKRYKVKGVLGKKIAKRKPSEMYLLPGDITVTVSENDKQKEATDKLIDDKLSHNYFKKASLKERDTKNINHLKAILKNITGYTLYKKDYISTKDNYSFSSYKDIAKLDVSLEIKDIKVRASYYSYSVTYKYDIKVSLVDYFGKEYNSITTTYKTKDSEEVMQNINADINKMLSTQEFKDLKSLIASSLSHKSEEWPMLNLSQKHPAKNKKEAISSVVSVVLEKGHGSGVIITENGYIISNYHVVTDNKTVKIATSTGDTLVGTVVRTNPEYDLALIKCGVIFPHSVDVLTNKWQAPKTGSEVSSVGSPLDLSLYGSVSKGIVVGKRVLNNIGFYQVNCSVNPGNSGGALINRKGQLVGIVNAKLIGAGVSKLGFAIPAYYFKKVLKVDVK